MINHR